MLAVWSTGAHNLSFQLVPVLSYFRLCAVFQSVFTVLCGTVLSSLRRIAALYSAQSLRLGLSQMYRVKIRLVKCYKFCSHFLIDCKVPSLVSSNVRKLLHQFFFSLQFSGKIPGRHVKDLRIVVSHQRQSCLSLHSLLWHGCSV